MTDYHTDVCPHCGKESKYYPNPYYYHRCDKCGEECGQSGLLTGIKRKEALEYIGELEDRIKCIKVQLETLPNV